MKKREFNTRTAYITAAITISLMLLLQMILLDVNHTREAKVTTRAYLEQIVAIIEQNEHQEKAMLASLKEDYTALSKAVAYYLDHDHSAIYDKEELKKISSLMSIDEIHIFDESGTIISSTIPAYVGYSFDSGEQMAYF
ncbi:MAG: GGDEF domain-containing protein, partial [Lachnospiraceae bacterium]|nr:GGDEF domain-containing protein [Lachnospiraceae bacterium]